MASEWYYLRDGQQTGPVSAADLKAMAAAGELTLEDLLWREGFAEWVEVSRISQLAAIATSTRNAPVVESAPQEQASSPVAVMPKAVALTTTPSAGRKGASSPASGQASATPLTFLILAIITAIGLLVLSGLRLFLVFYDVFSYSGEWEWKLATILEIVVMGTAAMMIVRAAESIRNWDRSKSSLATWSMWLGVSSVLVSIAMVSLMTSYGVPMYRALGMYGGSALVAALWTFLAYTWTDKRNADPSGDGMAVAMFVMNLLVAGGSTWLLLRRENPDAGLAQAIDNSQAAKVAEYVERKTDFNAKMPNGSLPLHYAVERGDIKIAKLLLSAGADPNKADDSNRTVLAIAQKYYYRKDLQQLLIQHGAR